MAAKKKHSWRTTAAGVASLLAAVGIFGVDTKAQRAAQGSAAILTSKESKTAPDWMLITALAANGLGLIFARDNKVSSEDVGAKPAT